MEPIFNFCAETVGWLENGIVFTDDGRPIAFIEGGAIFSAGSGCYLGQFAGGVFRDSLGCIVAVIRGAWRCTAVPMLRRMVPLGVWMPPSVQSRAVAGETHLPAAPFFPAKPLLNRSSLAWNRFVTGHVAQWPWETRL